jgi:hypothetical protein
MQTPQKPDGWVNKLGYCPECSAARDSFISSLLSGLLHAAGPEEVKDIDAIAKHLPMMAISLADITMAKRRSNE